MMTGATTARSDSIGAIQRRTIRILVGSQILSGAGLAAGITVGALLAQDMLGSTSLAGLPAALYTAGSALAALAVGRLSQRFGRRPGLAAGYTLGSIGSIGVVVAATIDNPILLFVSLFIYGAGTATNLQARYAGADLAEPSHRGRAVSIVLVSTTVGGVIGPNLATPTGHFATSLGIPQLAGPFLLSAAAYAAAAAVLTSWLRPDPLRLARELHANNTDNRPDSATAVSTHTDRRGVIVGATTWCSPSSSWSRS
jgi:MFS family permease